MISLLYEVTKNEEFFKREGNKNLTQALLLSAPIIGFGVGQMSDNPEENRMKYASYGSGVTILGGLGLHSYSASNSYKKAKDLAEQDRLEELKRNPEAQDKFNILRPKSYFAPIANIVTKKGKKI